ncbi:enoyl-CoA hydratase/isomerase [Geobacter metallireducens GS-15]|uniref:Enoyl-CoA hydratase/isomerase n=1 Tax=Geobacter metallireducens (strain ATCC 53774 / DSM 7210 / GS-15) TaxID=269799 RepID=Q39TK2_GEOMG|nr:enoyl-CoA hydratase/isomerase family protein [Geobacter metallireducens]ABB32422.1 enoyl-CoA hydratase/isomerase [Geobacter metallireducens GS-15]
MTEKFETIIFEKRGAIAVITMNRPDKLNACNTVMYRELDCVLDKIESDREVQAVVITGSGDKAFSAGADLEELNFDNLRDSSEYIKVDARAFRRLENIPQPVIAAVNGAAIGYGCKVAIVSDIAIASETAKFSLPGATFGAVHVIMLGRAREVMGRKRLSQLLLTGEKIDAHEAERYGIVNKVVPQDQVMAEAMKIANRIAECPPLSVQVTRRMLHRGMDDDYRWEDLLSPGLLLMEDVKEGRRAFKEKRKPKFVGK